MVKAEMDQPKSTFFESEKSSDYLLFSDERTVEDRMIGQMEMEEDIDRNEDLVDSSMKTDSTELSVFFREDLETRNKHTDYKEKKAYSTFKHYAEEHEGVRDFAEEDEETIATFVTAAGQQLALYAVEDSDDVFAVAVYDESGEPPTNFQFLMKSDVERLIGEGAVRTVKKPSQIKKQLLTTQPPMFASKRKRALNNARFDLSVKSHHQKTIQSSWDGNPSSNENYRRPILNSNSRKMADYPQSKQSKNLTYMMTNDTTIDVAGPLESSQDSLGSESELVEQSTVQYILLDGDQSDSELTFDEIQATLQSLQFSTNKSTVKKKANAEKGLHQQTETTQTLQNSSPETLEEKTKIDVTRDSPNNTTNDVPSKVTEIETDKIKNSTCPEQSDLIGTPSTETCSPQDHRSCLKENPTAKSTKDSSLDSKKKPNKIESKHHPVNILRRSISDGCTEVRPQIKRSRKQQLTSVNRGDSEIIIQPAVIGEEEDNNKKRGRRKKKPAPDPDYNPRPVRSKKSKKSMKNQKVEIIEIDVDEEQSLPQEKSDVIEITLDDNKEKGSSDKENDVIMLGDSDDEFQEIPVKPMPPAMQCKHCLRNFRQKRALDTHSRVCPKFRKKMEKANVGMLATASDASDKDESDSDRAVRKQFSCKVCDKKFNAVVELARHARMEHPKTSRNKSTSKSSSVEDRSLEKKIEAAKELMNQRRVTRINQKKKGQSSSQSWKKTPKLNCDDCGRWFPSRAILAAHCLQHATKNPEKQIRQCQTCKKLIKTRSLFLQHMKTHSITTRNTKPPTTVIHKQLRQTRQVTNKMTVKKRGRPRKL
ncbi:uncharacterized protein LOC105692279 isoform X1 [Athalia rosae]|uniref:uncharacterized protein LOC105692279 isoform X1 n=1 Tax=Athalia rosae TaxID=37344 RepID=UPI0020335326|nr:uncharacterized protein LOC105692279 isoform X1 [Athalia rosae]